MSDPNSELVYTVGGEEDWSFPCLVCGCELTRVHTYEAQPNDGVMCSSKGNYGSTVFDPFDLSELAFNICDGCLVTAGKQGRVMVTRYHMPVETGRMRMIGRKTVESPKFMVWHEGLDLDDEALRVTVDDLDALDADASVELRFTVDQIRAYEADEKARRAAPQ